ncbi:MAG: type II toxin-antitoxin system VapC family toxin [Opitutaceae bacterium]|jgi:predicted nucleic acid-binding protein
MAAPTYADTSFLVSLYVQDAHSERAAAVAAKLMPIFFTPLVEHELRNAIRLCVFRCQITSGQREKSLYEVERDAAEGFLYPVPLDWPKAFKHTEVLGRSFTESIGARGMDILHVGSALALRAKLFATFDDRQASLAKSAGLELI